jgi:hypothetical protein
MLYFQLICLGAILCYLTPLDSDMYQTMFVRKHLLHIFLKGIAISRACANPFYCPPQWRCRGVTVCETVLLYISYKTAKI